MAKWGDLRVRAPRARLVAALVVASVLLAGCSATTQAAQNAAEGGPSPEPISVQLTPADQTDDVAPRDPVGVEVTNGTLTEVSLIGTHGTVVKGDLNDDKTEWSVGEPLGYGRTYTLTAQGVGDDGVAVTQTSTFTTIVPASQVSVQTNIGNGATVGVGMPVSFQFSAPISDKGAAEEALRIETSPETEGAFHWFSDSWVAWRPKEYWTPGTEVEVEAEIYGRHFGGGVYGMQDVSRSMTVGDKVIAVADGKKHQMTVEIDGEQARTIPISMGKPSTPTPHGIYTVMSEHMPYTLDSSTYGVPVESARGYRTTVSHAARMSHSGIFYHSAPWSLWAQGNTNVSNGCINMSTEHADWMFRNTKPGDLIEVVNSGGPELAASNGWSVWQLSWAEWKRGGKA